MLLPEVKCKSNGKSKSYQVFAIAWLPVESCSYVASRL